MAQINVTFRTPSKVIFEGPADKVRLKTDLGRVEILPNHATLVSTVLFSKVYIYHSSTEEKFFMRQGTMAVDEKGDVILLANEAEKEAEMTIDSMQEYLTYLVAQIDSGKHNDYQMKFLREQREALQGSLTTD